ncbi:MAG: hypothetical protein WC755_03165 [Candidatus Woesearchaeota archaeon]|jgi:23S rRNA (uracil1939-C5)-methyltransferase
MSKQLEILSIASSGKGTGVVKEIQDGKELSVPYFVPCTVPGDIIEIKNEKKSKKYVEAEVDKVIIKSKYRVDGLCPNFTICGGCNILNVDYGEQRRQKLNIVAQILKRNNITHPPIKLIGCEKYFNYRYKAKVFVAVKDGVLFCGFMKRQSKEVIKVSECKIVHEKIVDFMKKFNDKKISGKYEETISVVVDFVTNNIATFCDTKNKDTIQFLKDNSSFFNQEINFSYLSNEIPFNYNEKTFIQSNLLQNSKLVDAVISNVDKREVLFDLYSGIGNFAILLSKDSKKILSVEGDLNSFSMQLANCVKNKITNVRCVHDEVFHFLKHTDAKPSTIILDPPRTGCDEKIIEKIVKLSPKKIIYVSCDPVSLKDNLKLLLKEYKILKMYVVDMFPNTEHIETVSVLERK